MFRYFVAVIITVLSTAAASAGQSGTRTISGWLHVTTPDGWIGRRYMDGGEVFAEEFDSSGNGRIDVWRFYRRGVLTSEERDLGGQGRINFQSRWDPRERRLLQVQRDTSRRGVNDLEIESAAGGRWEIREDRNLDGVADRILIAEGPKNLFERLGMNLYTQEDIIDSIPREYWRELRSDDSFTGNISDYRRFNRGELSHYGEWRNDRMSWRRVTPDFIPPPPPPALTYDPPRMEPPPAFAPDAGTGFSDYFEEPPSDSFVQYPTGPVQTTAPAARDRTRYEGLPPGESSARPLPAPMRPPGVGPR